MIVLGDASGIQNYVFDVAHACGGQAPRLRPQSFGIQLLAAGAALPVLRILGWPRDDKHFVLPGTGPGETKRVLRTLEQESSDWFLRETRGELRLAPASADDNGSEVAAYPAAMAGL
jgi:hypothetical protein